MAPRDRPPASVHAGALQQEGNPGASRARQLWQVYASAQAVAGASDGVTADREAPHRRVSAGRRIFQGVGLGRARGGAVPVVRLSERQPRDRLHDRQSGWRAAGGGALGAVRAAERCELGWRSSGGFVQQERFARCCSRREVGSNVGLGAIGSEETNQDVRLLGAKRRRVPRCVPVARDPLVTCQ